MGAQLAGETLAGLHGGPQSGERLLLPRLGCQRLQLSRSMIQPFAIALRRLLLCPRLARDASTDCSARNALATAPVSIRP
jgi:hypothetical protein